MQRVEIGQYLVIDPAICEGQMTFKGTNVTLDAVIALLIKGYSIVMVLEEYTELNELAVKEMITLATHSLVAKYKQPEETVKLTKRLEIGKFVVVDREFYHGEMTFRDTRLPVETVLDFLAMGESLDRLQKGWPFISREAIREAVSLAALALKKQYSEQQKIVSAAS